MTTTTVRSVGFCANYSKAGDWAFDFALELARSRALPLNVFHFLTNPYDPDDASTQGLTLRELEVLAIKRERLLRLYYDSRAGEYLEVGFRLCEDNEWKELHRCLLTRQFQVLVLGYVGREAMFSGRPIEEFADDFICPTILVGPNRHDEYRLNSRAALIAEHLGLPAGSWTPVEPVTT